MKRILTIGLLAMLAGCEEPPHVATQDGKQRMLVFTDDLTGCEYLYFYSGGITPRLSPDGTQICKKDERE